MKQALQLSGGRDSLATLFHLEDEWDDLVVAWCDGGDSAPELHVFMERIAQLVPRFERVAGFAPQVRKLYGEPTPDAWTACCSRAVWSPMMLWVIENHITCLIRGTRALDPIPYPTPGLRLFGVEFRLPIWDWDDEKLQGALDDIAKRGFKPVYPHDCLHCPVERLCDRPELRNVN